MRKRSKLLNEIALELPSLPRLDWKSHQGLSRRRKNVNLPSCSENCPFNTERQAGELQIPIFKLVARPD